MIEACIKGVCPEYYLADIGVRLRRGEVFWVSEDTARSSEEIRLAARMGAVSVVFTKRCAVQRSPPPPSSRMRDIMRNPARTPTPSATPSVAPSVAPFDEQALQNAITAGVSKAITDLLSSGVLVPGTRVGAVSTDAAPYTPVTNDPVYIPSRIVPEKTAPITVAQTSSGGAELEASAAALKATRKRKATSETP